MSEVVKKLFLKIKNVIDKFNDYKLNRKKHIQNYYQIRKFHNEIANNMKKHFDEGKYDMKNYYNSVINDVRRETKGSGLHLKTLSKLNRNILYELFMYKNHSKIPSISEIYSVVKRFRNKEKLKMLNSMLNSYVGLFKVINVDKKNGYVTYEDVFTHKRFKIIDIAMSKSLKIVKKKIIYIYNRIITYDNISFGTGINCVMSSFNQELQEFISKHQYNNCSDFSRCLMLYNISKKEKDLNIVYDLGM